MYSSRVLFSCSRRLSWEDLPSRLSLEAALSSRRLTLLGPPFLNLTLFALVENPPTPAWRVRVFPTVDCCATATELAFLLLPSATFPAPVPNPTSFSLPRGRSGEEYGLGVSWSHRRSQAGPELRGNQGWFSHKNISWNMVVPPDDTSLKLG